MLRFWKIGGKFHLPIFPSSWTNDPTPKELYFLWCHHVLKSFCTLYNIIVNILCWICLFEIHFLFSWVCPLPILSPSIGHFNVFVHCFIHQQHMEQARQDWILEMKPLHVLGVSTTLGHYQWELFSLRPHQYFEHLGLEDFQEFWQGINALMFTV